MTTDVKKAPRSASIRSSLYENFRSAALAGIKVNDLVISLATAKNPNSGGYPGLLGQLMLAKQ